MIKLLLNIGISSYGQGTKDFSWKTRYLIYIILYVLLRNKTNRQNNCLLKYLILTPLAYILQCTNPCMMTNHLVPSFAKSTLLKYNFNSRSGTLSCTVTPKGAIKVISKHVAITDRIWTHNPKVAIDVTATATRSRIRRHQAIWNEGR
jgi:hypothetical protein